MARGAALTGSLVVHAVALAALVARGAPRPVVARPGGVSTVAIELSAPPTPIAGVSRPPDAVSRPPMPDAASRPPPPHVASRAPVPGAANRTPAPTHAAADAIGLGASGTVETTLQIESAGGAGAGATDGATAGGPSAGGGNGIGFGAGGGIAPPVDTAGLATPEPPKPSLARPPRLLWPAQQGAIGDRPLYVAHITVDRDGFVAGARLIQGTGGARDLGATDAIWRFRYDPALDDDGRPVAAAIDQPFLLR